MRSIHTLPMLRMSRIMAAALLAGAGVLSLPALAQPGTGPGMMHARGAPHEHAGASGHFSARVLDAVKATPEQRAQIRQIMDAARKDLQGQREARRELRQEAMRIFSQPNIDAGQAEALRQKRLAQHELVSRRMSQAMLDAARVLTPEQRQQIAQRMERHREMSERHRQERRSIDGPKS